MSHLKKRDTVLCLHSSFLNLIFFTPKNLPGAKEDRRFAKKNKHPSEKFTEENGKPYIHREPPPMLPDDQGMVSSGSGALPLRTFFSINRSTCRAIVPTDSFRHVEAGFPNCDQALCKIAILFVHEHRFIVELMIVVFDGLKIGSSIDYSRAGASKPFPCGIVLTPIFLSLTKIKEVMTLCRGNADGVDDIRLLWILAIIPSQKLADGRPICRIFFECLCKACKKIRLVEHIVIEDCVKLCGKFPHDVIVA